MSDDFDPSWAHGHIYDGQQARVICTNAKGDHPVVALITSSGGETEYTRFFKLSGESYTSPFLRIYNAPAPKRKMNVDFWLNVYEDPPSWPSKEVADNAALKGRVACLHIVREFEEGDGL
jgi:hypothetical protein